MLEQFKQQLTMVDSIKQRLNQADIDYLYNLGVRHFQTDDFNTACTIFQLLATIDIVNPLFFKSLAGCHQALEKWHDAYFNYKYVWVLDSTHNSDCLFFAGVCSFKLKHYAIAKQEFSAYLLTPNPDTKIIKRISLYLANEHLINV